MTTEEIQKAKRIVLKYKEIDSRIANLNDQLKRLGERKNRLELELNKTKKEEKAFVLELEKKYGVVDYNQIAMEIAR